MLGAVRLKERIEIPARHLIFHDIFHCGFVAFADKPVVFFRQHVSRRFQPLRHVGIPRRKPLVFHFFVFLTFQSRKTALKLPRNAFHRYFSIDFHAFFPEPFGDFRLFQRIRKHIFPSFFYFLGCPAAICVFIIARFLSFCNIPLHRKVCKYHRFSFDLLALF